MIIKARLINFCSQRDFDSIGEAMEWIVNQNFEATLEIDGSVVNVYSPTSGWRF